MIVPGEAIITRDLVDTHPLFRDKICLSKQKRISNSETFCFTNVITLYDILDIVLRDKVRGWKDFKRARPEESVINNYKEEAYRFWDLMTNNFPSLEEIKINDPRSDLVLDYRNSDGGNILFRPIVRI